VLDQGLASLPPKVTGDRRLLHGSPVHVIPEASEDFDLLVVGSRGYGPLRRTLLGSASRGIVDRARCSVLAVTRGGMRPDSDREELRASGGAKTEQEKETP
jgi:nucleotide-binding universal stress UspA family protein